MLIAPHAVSLLACITLAAPLSLWVSACGGKEELSEDAALSDAHVTFHCVNASGAPDVCKSATILSSSCIGNEYFCEGAKAVSSCPSNCIGYCTASTTQLSDSGILSAYSCFYPPLTVAEAHAQCSTILGPGEWHPCGADANATPCR
jgi:hypothetical protein